MSHLQRIWDDQYEEVAFFQDRKTGIRSIISIHSTVRGPSLGGARFYPYANTEDALHDVLRLSRAMTYKAAAADLGLGGGKSVIIGDPARHKTREVLLAFGRFIESLGGRYISAEDSGTSPADFDIMREATRYVVGLSPEKGGSGDPSPWTAKGVVIGMEALSRKYLGQENLKGVRIAVQGVGHVGYCLVEELVERGAKIICADVDEKKVKKAVNALHVESVPLDKILSVDCEIFAPCAMGGVISADSVNQLRCKIVAGAANNQLAEDAVGDLLVKKGIIYAPDFVINAGGLISVCREWFKFEEAEVGRRLNKIGDRLLNIIGRAQELKLSPSKTALEYAEQNLKGR